MSGGIAQQIGLIAALERYERGERLAQWFPDLVEVRLEADRRHDVMFRTAMACGFDPAWSGMTSLDWCRKRAEQLNRVFPNNVREGTSR